MAQTKSSRQSTLYAVGDVVTPTCDGEPIDLAQDRLGRIEAVLKALEDDLGAAACWAGKIDITLAAIRNIAAVLSCAIV